MKSKFYHQLLSLAPDTPSARFLLAVSGGRDSVALAHLFADCGLTFDIAHCNFHLREEESNQEMLFVKNLPFLTTQKVYIKEFDTYSIQKQSGKSIEMIARELRYQWFEELKKEYNYIVTAHHANDNAETVIMNMLRGTGMRGLYGIPPKNNKIIRPLLRFSSSEIEQYCFENNIGFCNDSSNFSDLFLRNKIRHHIIPELEKINPKIMDSFSKNSDILLQQTHFFDTHIQHYKQQIIEELPNQEFHNIECLEPQNSNHRILISIENLKKIEFQSLVLYEILNPYGFNSDDVDNVLKTINTHSGKKFMSETFILIKDRKYFILEKIDARKSQPVYIHTIEELTNHGFSVELIKNTNTDSFAAFLNVLYVPKEKLTFPLTLRTWTKGDYFYPFGMKQKKKLSDFFTDLKINLLEKQKIRLLCSENNIVWVINYRSDERYRVDSQTEWYYKIRLET